MQVVTTMQQHNTVNIATVCEFIHPLHKSVFT